MGHKPRHPTASTTIAIDGVEFDEQQLVDECSQALDELLEREGVGDDFASYEGSLLKLVHRIVREKLQKKLQTIADGVPNRVVIDHSNDWHGIREGTAFRYRRHAPGTVTYHSLVGPLRVRRHTYRECHRYGALYVPLELAAGLVERMTPGLAKCLAIGHAYMPSRQCEQFMHAGGLQPPSRSTLDRAARDLGAYAVACQEEIEPLVRANEVLDRSARAISLGLDRTAVPMRHGEERSGIRDYGPDLRRSRPKPRERAHTRGPVQWRMDYVGTVSLLDGEGKLLVTRKYRLPAEAKPTAIVERMIADVRHALVQRPHLSIAVVQDGAPQLWKLLNGALQDEPLVSTWTQVLDWYHLDERLSSCLELCTTAERRKSQRKRWHAQLLGRGTGIRSVIRSLRHYQRSLNEARADELELHIKYFIRNRKRTQYGRYRETNTPIGSGITEGACKSVIGARAKRSGQRWSQRGLSAALHLRAIHQSDRFESFWSFFSQQYRAKHIVEIGAFRH